MQRWIYEKGGDAAVWIKIQTAFVLLDAVVQTYHHRQFPDLLAVLAILYTSDRSDVARVLMEGLIEWANTILERNDPRKKVFQEISRLPMDTSGHLYLAFDACCRQLWIKKSHTTWLDPGMLWL